MAPKILRVNDENMEILMEDLGNQSLYSYVYETGDTSIYIRILDLMKRMQSLPCEGLPPFDEEHFAYEIDYFLHYNPDMKHLRGFLMENIQFLVRDELLVFMHRDFQSRNIFLTPSGPRVIDFQTAHCAHPYYDLASLFWDPYVSLEEETIEALSMEYGVDDFPLLKRFAIQRLAQALGAFKKLSPNKPFFRRFIEPTRKRILHLVREFREGAD